MSNNAPLSPGYYVGIRRTLRSFSFSLPKLAKGLSADTSMDDFFNQLNSGVKVKPAGGNTNVPNPGREKSTSFSGWIPTTNARNLSDKCYAAPEIWAAAGGDSPDEASALVKRFKKNASAVLGRCADTGESITEATASEINRYQCIVHELKIVILRVSSTEILGGRYDEKTRMWYLEKTIRKFYVTEEPLDVLLNAFAKEIADESTNVTAERKLVAVRADKVTPRTGRNARTSTFRIVTVSAGFSSDDEPLLAAINRIKARFGTPPDGEPHKVDP